MHATPMHDSSAVATAAGGGADVDDALEDHAPDHGLSWWARPGGTALMLVITSVIALASTITIIVERSILSQNPDYRTSCDLNPWMSCGTVMQSWQAMTFGWPNTYVGIVGFSALITVGVSLFAGARFARWYWLLLNLGLLAGFAFAVWLWYSAVYEIATLCLYCMIVWAMVIIQLVLVTSRNIQTGVLPAPAGLRSAARDLAWPVIFLLCVAVAASILLQLGLGVLGIG